MFRIHKISPSYQFFMWFSGLRGAIAFALAIDSVQHFEQGEIILTLTLVYAVITIILVGGGIAPLLSAVSQGKPDLDKSIEPDSAFQVHSKNCFKKLKYKMKEWDQQYMYPCFVKEEPDSPVRTPQLSENLGQESAGIQLNESQEDTPPEL